MEKKDRSEGLQEAQVEHDHAVPLAVAPHRDPHPRRERPLADEEHLGEGARSKKAIRPTLKTRPRGSGRHLPCTHKGWSMVFATVVAHWIRPRAFSISLAVSRLLLPPWRRVLRPVAAAQRPLPEARPFPGPLPLQTAWPLARPGAHPCGDGVGSAARDYMLSMLAGVFHLTTTS